MLIILTILTVIWALVWRFTVSVLVGIAVFYFLPPQHETYTPSSKINAQFSVPVLKNENGECVLKRWTEFDSVQDKICTQSFEDMSCFPVPQTKTGCDLQVHCLWDRSNRDQPLPFGRRSHRAFVLYLGFLFPTSVSRTNSRRHHPASDLSTTASSPMGRPHRKLGCRKKIKNG